MAAMCPCAPRSTACRCCRRTRMPTRSCAGCAGSSARPGKPSSCMASRRRRAAPAHQGRAGLALPGGGAERRGGAGLTGGAALPRPPRSIVPAVARALGQRSRARRTGRKTADAGLRAATSCPARKASRHRHSGATASPAPARAASSAVDSRAGPTPALRDRARRPASSRASAARRPAGRSAAGPGRGAFGSLPLHCGAHTSRCGHSCSSWYSTPVRNPRRRHRHVDHALGQRRQQGGRRHGAQVHAQATPMQAGQRRQQQRDEAAGGADMRDAGQRAACARASSMPSSASRCGPACRSSSTAAGVGASPRGSR